MRFAAGQVGMMAIPYKIQVVLAASLAAFVGSGPGPAQASDVGTVATPRIDALPAFAQARRSDLAISARRRSEPRKRYSDVVVPPGPIQIVISIKHQRATLYANGVEVVQGPVSTGTASHPTPMGLFSIIQKNRHHVSNIYGAPMPYMQRITWSGAAIHQGPLPGYPASHGCVRLPTEFARLLWKTTRLGARVVIARDEVRPVDIEHPQLFVPRPQPVVTVRQPPSVKVPDSGDVVPGAAVTALATPIEALASVTPGADAQVTLTMSSDPDKQPAPAPIELAALPEAVPSARDQRRRSNPVSVFVSRKDGKLYVRQALEPLFDAPVTIKDPDRPIGTHLFTAIEPRNGGTAMRWNAISLPSNYPRAVAAASNTRARPGARPGPAVTAVAALPGPAEALERLELSQDIRDQIGALLTPGSSLIISDNTLASGETGKGTDFIVLTK